MKSVREVLVDLEACKESLLWFDKMYKNQNPSIEQVIKDCIDSEWILWLLLQFDLINDLEFNYDTLKIHENKIPIMIERFKQLQNDN